jgi:MFS transporter, putative metabolite:H+ symporter
MSSAKNAQSRGFIAELFEDKLVALTIIVGALGYFVDVFDLLLFTIVRVQSLKDIGVPEKDLLDAGVTIISWQMAGLLLGGLLWGVLGDRLGRLSVLFGSILLYSLANIANAYVQTVDQYAILRFITGLGLAGELGVGVTLASELLPKRLRGLGTTLIATVGVMGASAAAIISHYTDWRTAYIIGGVMGLVLLVLRVNVKESGMYKKIAGGTKKVSRGDLFMLLTKWDLLRRYLAVICIGAPIWGVIGLLIMFTPEFARDFGLSIQPTAVDAVLYCYIGTTFGSFFSGALSQRLKSRRKSIAVSLIMMIVFLALFVTVKAETLWAYYTLCGLLGVAAGYWAMFVQVGAEQFGTNIRATAATSIPNVVRGLTIPMSTAFRAMIPAIGVTMSGLAVMAVALGLAFIGLYSVRETFHEELDYIEV